MRLYFDGDEIRRNPLPKVYQWDTWTYYYVQSEKNWVLLDLNNVLPAQRFETRGQVVMFLMDQKNPQPENGEQTS